MNNIIKTFEQFNFTPDLGKKKKTWYLLDSQDILKISDNVIDLIKTAYKNTEHGSYVNNDNDILKSTEWIAIDWDQYPDADVVIFGRKTPFGIKIQGIGHDGDPISKKLVIEKLVSILKDGGYWIESSDKVESILYKNDVPYVDSEKELKIIFPNSYLKFIGDKGKYIRKLSSGKSVKETVFGLPKIKNPN